MNCLVIAGEKSGEEHCLSFIPQIKKKLPDLKFWGVGGDELESLGMELLYHVKEFSSFGISNVIGRIPFYLKALKHIEDEVDKRNCKVAILVDFQGFNLKLAQKLSKKGVKVLYYVAPQAWAWKPWRAKQLAKSVHSLFVLLPFEKEWFKSRGVERVFHVTHPIYSRYYKSLTQKRKLRKQLLLLPGSRNTELQFLLNDFLKVAQNIKSKYQFEIGMVKTNSVKDSWYQYAGSIVDNFYESDKLEEALSESYMALASSGTVTLTCGLFSLPTVVAYKLGLINEFFVKYLVSYKGFVSLNNIMLGKEVFPEFLQDDIQVNRIEKKLFKWIEDSQEYQGVKKELEQIGKLIQGEEIDIPLYMEDIIKGAVS